MIADHGLTHGQRLDTGALVFVDDVESGLGCGLVCPACQRRLIAAKGPVYRHHFKHEADEHGCVGAVETMRHKLAKQILAECKTVWQPTLEVRWHDVTEIVIQGGAVSLDEVSLEVGRGAIRPDAVAVVGSSELAIEFYVTHGCDAEKIGAFAEMGLAAIEISVAEYHEDYGKYADYVLRDAPRWWLFHPGAAAAAARCYAEYARKEAEREAREAAVRAAYEAGEKVRRERVEAERKRREAEDAVRQKLIREVAERAGTGAVQPNVRLRDDETPEGQRSLAYWHGLTPEENAKICAGLRKGFDDHYWELRDRQEVVALRSKPPVDDDAAVAA